MRSSGFLRTVVASKEGVFVCLSHMSQDAIYEPSATTKATKSATTTPSYNISKTDNFLWARNGCENASSAKTISQPSSIAFFLSPHLSFFSHLNSRHLFGRTSPFFHPFLLERTKGIVFVFQSKWSFHGLLGLFSLRKPAILLAFFPTIVRQDK